MTTHNAKQIKTAVRDHYAGLVKSGESCCTLSNSCGTEINIEASLKGQFAISKSERIYWRAALQYSR